MKTLVLNACGLNLGFLGCYGNDWVATPNIDRIAAEGVVFDRHFIAMPIVEAPSLKEWLRSLDGILDRPGETIWVPGPTLAPPWELPADMLAVYSEDDEVEAWPNPPEGELEDDESLCRVQDTYAAVVTWFDARIGELLDEIDRCGLADEMLLALTSTSGYPLGEHGHVGWDRPWLHEELVHVPLILRLPKKHLAGVRVSAITQPDDLTATLAGTSTGRDLIALADGTIETLRPHASSSWQVGTRSESAVRTAEWAFLLPSGDTTRTRQLYEKPDDRWEVNDVAAKETDIADELERLLKT